MLNVETQTAGVSKVLTGASPALVHFVASDERSATTCAQVLRDGFSGRRVVGKLRSHEAHFQIVEHNANNDHAEASSSGDGLSCGENPSFRFLLAEHF